MTDRRKFEVRRRSSGGLTDLASTAEHGGRNVTLHDYHEQVVTIRIFESLLELEIIVY